MVKHYSGKRRPVSAADVLSRTFGSYQLRDRVGQYLPLQNWNEIVGEELAKVTAPEKIIRQRVLVIRVLDSAWAQELALRKEELLKKLLAFAPELTVSEIQFVTGDPRRLSNGKK